jgi:hypothetical protein
MKAVKAFLFLSFSAMVLWLAQGGIAPSAAQTPNQAGLAEDDLAALARWGSTDDPYVAALFTAAKAEETAVSSTLDEVFHGYDKETGHYLDDPTITRFTAVPFAPEPEKATPQSDVIRFGAHNMLAVTPGMAAGLRQQLEAADPPAEYLAVQFAYPVDIAMKEELAARGVVFGDPLDPLSFYAKIPAEAVTAVTEAIAQGNINFVGQVPPPFQISEGLQAEINGLNGAETAVAVTVQFFEPPTEAHLADLQKVMTIERASNGAIFLVDGTLPASAVLALAANPAVQMVHEQIRSESGSFETPTIPPPLAGVQANLEGNLGTGGDIVKNNGFTGTGINVMVMDSGIAHQGSTFHPDLPLSRITDRRGYFPTVDTTATAIDSHGTHVAGSIGGSGVGTSDRSWQGIAPNVNFLIYRLCCNVPGGFGYFNSDFQASLERGASNTGHVSNNSWGGGNNTYAVSSQLADRAVRGEFGNRWMNMVIITHNDNALSRSPGTAKNAITVGAVKDGNWPNTNVASCPGGGSDTNWPPGERICFSNFGPIDIDGDGHSRVKPDLMAPGVRTRSAVAWYQFTPVQNYDTWNGTSMAAPQVTGGVAQFLHAFPGYRSWPEVVKAALIASATNVGGTDIARYGRGMINTYHAIYDQAGISDTSRWTGSLSTSGAANDHTFTVPAGYSEIRIALTWADPVAGAGSDTVINDLDLRVYDANNSLRGSSLTVDDTVEYIKITNTSGAPGTWRIRVNAFSISSAQPYGLASVVVMRPASLSASTTLEPQVGVTFDNSFYLYSTISNSGFAAPGAYVRLQLPSTTLFTVQGARIYTADGRSHYYSASELHNDVAGLYWRAAVGEAIANHPRVVRWFIRHNGAATCPGINQTFTANAYFRDNGGLAVGGSSSSAFKPVACTFLPITQK